MLLTLSGAIEPKIASSVPPGRITRPGRLHPQVVDSADTDGPIVRAVRPCAPLSDVGETM